jgi:hypothetical protein
VEFAVETFRQMANRKKAEGRKPEEASRRQESRKKVKWRLLLPGASEPRLTELNPSGL